MRIFAHIKNTSLYIYLLIDEDSHQFINQPSKKGLTVAEAEYRAQLK
jgi:hypothetical protein